MNHGLQSSLCGECPSCCGKADFMFRSCDYNRGVSPTPFDYCRCAACGLIFLSNVPSDLGRYYPENYYAIPRTEVELVAAAESLQSWKLNTVLRFVRTGRLLEIGPAYGLFAFLAKRAGFDVTVIERDSRCCQFLRQTVGIEVVESTDPSAALDDLAPFDAIVLWQVIEHLPDSWRVIAAAARRLAPNGVLLVDTPNPDSMQFKLFGPHWAHVDAPRHVVLIPVSLLTNWATLENMQTAWMTASGDSAKGYNGFGWAFSLMSYFKSEPNRRVAHIAGRLVAKLLIPVERTGWRGSTYTAAFRKPRQ
jgi:SAM-dependent methyltransferase